MTVACIYVKLALNYVERGLDEGLSVDVNAAIEEHLALAEVNSDFFQTRGPCGAQACLEADAKRLPSIWPSVLGQATGHVRRRRQ
jgi:hypothetical protein